MELINAITYVGPIDPRPDGNAHIAVIWMAVVAVVTGLALIVALIATSIDRFSPQGHGRHIADWQVWLAAMVLAAVSMGSAIAFGLPAAHESRAERTEWSARVAEWAESTYGVTAGANKLSSGRDCPAALDGCYSGTVFVGRKLTAVTLIVIGDTAVLVDGNEKNKLEAKELRRLR